jgi:Tfp pilus assembly protein PilF
LVGVLAGCASSAQVRLQADERYQLAQSYLGGDSYSLAEQEVRKALALVPDEPRYFELLALIYQAQGRLHPAEEAYRLALQQAEVPPSVLVNYATLLLLSERVDEAISFLQRALKDPTYDRPALAHTNLGLAYFKKGLLNQAMAQLRQALEYRPELPEAHYNLGLLYVRLQEPEKAIREFREAIRFRPTYVEAHASLGRVLLQTGRPEEARRAFERVVTLAPDSDMGIASRKQLKLLTP